jgi:hypothetical protein
MTASSATRAMILWRKIKIAARKIECERVSRVKRTRIIRALPYRHPAALTIAPVAVGCNAGFDGLYDLERRLTK